MLELSPYYIFVAYIFSSFIAPESKGLKFYSGDESHEYSCNFQFDQSVSIDCACVDGLWVLYDTCETENLTIAGNKQYCRRLLDVPVSKGVQLLKNKEELVILEADGSITPNPVGKVVDGHSTLISGTDWIIETTSGAKICLAFTESNVYCFFANLEENSWEINSVSQGCDQGYDYLVDPFKCHIIEEDTHDLCEHSEIKRRYKRQDDGGGDGADGGGASAASGDTPSGNLTAGEITPDDEDYLAYNKSLEARNDTDTSPISIASGIMDYMKKRLAKILVADSEDTTVAIDITENTESNIPDVNSRGGNPLNVTYTNPVYEFLELSKRVTQKTCPPHYVNPEFLNLAVATFINMQQIRFKFPEQSFRPSGFRRVLNFLRMCEAEAKPFNFTDSDCDGKVDGNYTAFGETLELTITSEFVDLTRDPVIETVWKVFFNAHSYCFPYFNKTLDHHRFATWMIPLFQNEMNALWVEGNTTEDSLSGLFGNQVLVQGNLGYCAVSSRLDSGYPWDLPRPAQIPEFGGASNKTEEAGGEAGGEPAAPADGGGRRKRAAFTDADYILQEDTNDILNMGTCMDTTKPVLCSSQVKSIVQSQDSS